MPNISPEGAELGFEPGLCHCTYTRLLSNLSALLSVAHILASTTYCLVADLIVVSYIRSCVSLTLGLTECPAIYWAIVDE